MTVSNVVSPLMVSADRFVVGSFVSLAAVSYYATPFEAVTKASRFRAIIDEFRPHVLHTHYVTSIPQIARVAATARLPYTVRAHSFDAIPIEPTEKPLFQM